jgi:uncharacterized protein YcaQ
MSSNLLAKAQARQLWLRAQRLDRPEPFGSGPGATERAVEHLGYVQIDTIHVIERSHHHVLFTRIPAYRRAHLERAQSVKKSLFEYWTHALAYVPTRDYRFFIADMKRRRAAPPRWFGRVKPADLNRVVRLIRRDGPLTIRDFEDEVLVERAGLWMPRKPSKLALQVAFFGGTLTVSRRHGMLKTYELPDRHFGWKQRPKPASEREILDYMLARALRAQAVVSVDSICHLETRRKRGIKALVEREARAGRLCPVRLEGSENVEHWVEAGEDLRARSREQPITRLLSPFDPLVIQRKRLKAFFDYEHRFEAYVPKAKRVFGYFALPVLVDDRIVALIDLKTDRGAKRMLIQQWTWIGRSKTAENRRRIEEELGRFERFQLET